MEGEHDMGLRRESGRVESSESVRPAVRRDYHGLVKVRAEWLDGFYRAHPAEQQWCPATCPVPGIADERAILRHLAGAKGKWAAVSEDCGKAVAYILCRIDRTREELLIEGQTPRLCPEAEFGGCGRGLLTFVVQQAAKRGLKRVRMSYHGFPGEVTPLIEFYEEHGFSKECKFEMLNHHLRIDPRGAHLQFRSAEDVGLEVFFRGEAACGYCSSPEHSRRRGEFSRKTWAVQPDTDWLVAYDGEDLVGTVRVAVTHEGVGILDGIAMAPQCRGKGIGRAVLARGLSALVGRTDLVYLDVHHNNPAAMRLYEGAGFRTHHVHGEMIMDLAGKETS